MDRPDVFLVGASREGDHDAYAELVRRNLKRVFAICLALLGETADAEDAAQEVFVKAWQRIGGLRDSERFASWIDQIARNRCRDRLRSGRRRPEHPLTSFIEETAPAPADDFGDLRAALRRLPSEYREPLLLYYFDGRDTRTLARDLGLSQGGACACLHRARLRLRRLLEEEATDET